MPALATVELRPTYNAKPRKARISAKVKVAIDAMVIGGLSRDAAAKHAGIADNTLYIALRKPEVLQYRMTQMEVMRTSESSRTFARIAKLADEAESEHVRLDASKHLGALDGITAVQRTESTINLRAPSGPGLMVFMAAPLAPVIDSQAHEIEMPNEYRHLPAPVPHPSKGTTQILRGIARSPAEGEGEK